MYKRILISLTILLCHTIVMAQEFVLTGKVTDAQDNVIELASIVFRFFVSICFCGLRKAGKIHHDKPQR